MTDVFPKEIRIRIVDASRRNPVPGVPVLLMLVAERKNDYPVGPLISDQAGRVVFTRSQMTESITLNQKHFPMDYAGKLDECSVVEIRILGRDGIHRLLDANRLWGAAIPEFQLSDDLQSKLLVAERTLGNGVSRSVSREHLDEEIVVEIGT